MNSSETTETVHLTVTFRQQQLVDNYVRALDNHISDLRTGKVQETLEIRDFADLLHVHPGHLSNTIQNVLGQSPCDLYENKLVELAKQLLLTTDFSIGEIARQLTYDPSNFTKFFKHFEGITPKEFRRLTKRK